MDQFEHLSDGGRLEQRLDLVAKYLHRSVCPLFKPRGYNKPDLRACAVAYTERNQVFLLTASHAVKALDMNDFHIWTPAAWVMARGKIACTNTPRGGHDAVDAAVIWLDPDVVTPHLRQNALTIKDIDPPADHYGSDHLIELISYPGGEVDVVGEQAISPKWYQWAGIGASESDYKKRGRRRDYHQLFHFDRGESVHKDLGRHPGPDMHGASGGGMWRILPINEDIQRERWALLSAIFTEYEGRMIIGTRVGAHLGLIQKYFS
jgi:hypothetical protein